jgi:hypothetical protein
MPQNLARASRGTLALPCRCDVKTQLPMVGRHSFLAVQVTTFMRCYITFLLFVVPCARVAAQPAQVDLHGRFERAIRREKVPIDPYAEPPLEATFVRPDGREVRWWGFFDGDSTWKVRFTPDRVGSWSYRLAFPGESPSAAGSFECIPSNRFARIQVYQPNPVWFGTGEQQPLLVRGLHVGDRFLAANWPDERRARFLDWAQANGYNLLSIGSCLLNRDAPGRGRGWDTPRLWPLNAAEFQRLELLLDELARRRIYVFPFAGFFGQSSNYPRDPADQERYLRYAIARLAPYGNLLWNVAGPEPNVRNSWMAADDVERLGRLIRSLDPFGHPLSVHNRTGDDPYRDSDWTTYGVLQGPKTLDRARLRRGLAASHHPGKPLLAQETLWSGNVNHIGANGRDYSDDDLRKNAYVIHMSAASLVFADNAGNSSSGFSGTMDLAECRQPRHDVLRGVWDLLQEWPTHRMVPRQDLVSSGYCLAEPGASYLVYLDEPAALDVRIEGGPYRIEWINASRPGDRRRGETTSDGRNLQPPGGGDDWLLRLAKVP